MPSLSKIVYIYTFFLFNSLSNLIIFYIALQSKATSVKYPKFLLALSHFPYFVVVYILTSLRSKTFMGKIVFKGKDLIQAFIGLWKVVY